MKLYLILLATLAALVGYPNEHLVSVYYGHVRGTTQSESSQRLTRIATRALIVVDWQQTEDDIDTGLMKLARVAIVTPDGQGGFTTVEYTTNGDSFSLVSLPGNNLGIALTVRAEADWQTLVLKGAIGRRVIDRTRWHVPAYLRGRNLVYSTVGEPTAQNTRYSFRFHRPLTSASASIADPASAFDAALENAETVAQNL